MKSCDGNESLPISGASWNVSSTLGHLSAQRFDVNIFLIFGPTFLEWPLAVCRALRVGGLSVSGLVAGPEDLFRRVAGAQDIAIARLHRLDELERKWIATPLVPGARAAYEAMLGADVFQRLTIADAHLGRGFISGGETPASALAKAVEDPDVLERYLVGLLGYAFDELSTGRPDVVFCHTVSDAPALAFALAAQHLDIPLAQLRHTRIGNRVTIDTVPYDRLEPVREIFERYVLTPSAQPEAATREAEAYLTALRGAGAAPDYLAYHAQRVQQSLRPGQLLRGALASARTALGAALKRKPQDLRCVAPLTLGWHELQVARRAARLLRDDTFRPVGWRPTRSFAVYPLHVDPESSTTVQSPLHTDQLGIIEAIAKGLPNGMPLLVKEHLPMLGRRPPGFYARLRRLPGVELCSPFEQGAALVREATLTTVISSTAGWEAIVLGRPTLVMAFPPYAMVNDGFVAEPELTRLGGALRAALDCPPASERRLQAYVAAALESSFACPTDVMWRPVTEETVRENPQILQALVERLRALAKAGTGPRADLPQPMRRAGNYS